MSPSKSQSDAGTSAETVAPNSKGRLKSMTGYAQSRAIENGWSLRVSIRAVNHRFLDLHLRVPEGFEPMEPRIRQIVRERIRRGHLDLTLHYELAGPAAVGVNEEIAGAYLQAMYALRNKFELRAEPDLASLFRLPGVIGSPSATLDDELARIEPVVAQCLAEALEKLDLMREQEARALCAEMSGRLGTIAAHTSKVRDLAERARPAFALRLETRLRELLGETQLDLARLAQEAAIAAERSDVSEELARLGSHVQQFQSLLDGASDAGKKLDFLLQEMQRETNTLLSKTPGTEAEGLEITRLGLDIKSEIEKLREQVQNIE